MTIWTIILIALALAMDAFAVSIASGITIKQTRIKYALIMGAWFGSFQAIMPFLGWLAGLKLRNFIAGMDHWVAFALLSFIGCKMIYESFKMDSIEERTNPFDFHVLFMLAIATSIDALATGMSFAVLKIEIFTPVLIIGLITFIMSFTGVLIGEKGGHFFEKKIEFAGGLLLICIGLKILLSHLSC
ncbi:MAG: manganese efflux pump MntP family protein [Kiritimatiellae bacterium]|nr:manganese efflux pump MntP family protein [Kiritimatiellia bacterium]MDD5519387.1 manganese efflux pump MntP family protein [Kiritimatiellia bacterium]